jgi:hypothetical protein
MYASWSLMKLGGGGGGVGDDLRKFISRKLVW